MRQHNRLPHESANARALHRRINKSFQLDGANIRKPNDNTNAGIGNTCNQLLQMSISLYYVCMIYVYVLTCVHIQTDRAEYQHFPMHPSTVPIRTQRLCECVAHIDFGQCDG